MNKIFKPQIIILLVLFAVALYVGVLLYKTTAATEEVSLSFLDVGQGDSEFISIPGMRMMIDGGPPRAVLGALASILPPTERTIDILLMSHPELDHFGGFIDILKIYDVRLFVSSGRTKDTKSYGELSALVKNKNIPWVTLEEGDSIDYGDYHFAVLGPSPAELKNKAVNESSLVLMLTGPYFSALYTGDIGEATERRLVKDYDLDIDILKVPHHGSRFSSSEAFLSEITPLYAITEVGRNSYGHPTKETLSRLGSAAETILRTDQNGTITLMSTKEGIVQEK